MPIGLITKALIAAFTAVLAPATAALQDGHIDRGEWVLIVSGLIAGFVFTWLANNSGRLRYAKVIASAATSLAVTLVTMGLSGFSVDQIASLLVAAIGSVLVGIAPNAAQSDGTELDPATVATDGSEGEGDDAGEEPAG